MRKVFVLGLKLFLLAAVAGLALGVTNMITAPAILVQQEQAADAAQKQMAQMSVRAGETDPDKLTRVMHIEECVSSLDQLFSELLLCHADTVKEIFDTLPDCHSCLPPS